GSAGAAGKRAARGVARCAVAGRRRTGADISGLHRTLSDLVYVRQMAAGAGRAEHGAGSLSVVHAAADRLAHHRVRLAAGTRLDDPAGAAADRLVGAVWKKQPGRASVSERGGTRRARARAARECGLRHLMVTHVGVDEEPRRAGAHRLLPVHELRVLPVGELVLPVSHTGAALHGAAKR